MCNFNFKETEEISLYINKENVGIINAMVELISGQLLDVGNLLSVNQMKWFRVKEAKIAS